MTITTTKIASVHDTLAEAVEAANIDLSYNATLAAQDIKATDRNVAKAYVMADGTIQYVFEARDGGKFLNKFAPFHNCLDNGPFHLATIKEDKKEVMVSHQNWPKSTETRKHARDMGLILT